MEKIIIRTKIVPGISSAIIQESGEKEKIYDLINRLGKEALLEKIFNEKDETCDYLFKEYEKLQKGIKSPYFLEMYVISSKFGVVLDEHIYLYRCNLQIYNQHREVIPWGYAESKKYLGDTWWSEDREILFDLKNLHIIEFLDKYKGY